MLVLPGAEPVSTGTTGADATKSPQSDRKPSPPRTRVQFPAAPFVRDAHVGPFSAGHSRRGPFLCPWGIRVLGADGGVCSFCTLVGKVCHFDPLSTNFVDIWVILTHIFVESGE